MLKFNDVIKVVDKDHDRAKEMSKELDISLLTAKVLVNRGISEFQMAKEFLNPSLDKFNDPYLLKDMDKCVERILQALENKENVWIYGDYDVDGVTSTSVLMIFLRKLGLKANYYIPDRMSEGYGLNKEAIDYIKDNNGDLIITVDCGITSIDEVEHCKDNDIDIIITDHHQCGVDIPDALAVVNPHRKDCKYPFKKLAGVGVAFKLVQALAEKLDIDIEYSEILPIVAIGTVADVVSLTGENRIIVKNGLDMIKESYNYGIQALLSITGLDNKEVSSGHIGFVIGPRINAGGRIGLAKYGVELFISDTLDYASELAKKLDNENDKRQNIEKEILDEALELIEKDIDLVSEKVIVLASDKWHHGVIGIVSSRITEKYSRPSILISIEDDEGRGSARSISSFDMYEGLSKCKELFNKFGGHSQAAGLSLDKENISLLRNEINKIANETLVEEDLIPQTVVDCEIETSYITKKTINELKLLQPFGIDNSSPQFLLRRAKVVESRAIGKEGNHIKLVIEKANKIIDCIGFRFGNLGNELKTGDIIDIVATLEINSYMNREKVQLNIKNIIRRQATMNKIKNRYYPSLCKSLQMNTSKYLTEKEGKINLIKDVDRESYILDILKNQEGVLVLINNYYNIANILEKIQLHGREIIRRTKISYETYSEDKPNNIVINPVIEKINFGFFRKIFIYDLLFDKIVLNQISNLNNNTFDVFLYNEDIMRNNKVLEYIIPTIDDLRFVYKNFLSKGKEILKVNIEKYIIYLSSSGLSTINATKLLLVLEILEESNLIEFKQVEDDYYIRLNEKPNKKIDIANVPKFKYLCEIKNNVNNNYNFIKHV